MAIPSKPIPEYVTVKQYATRRGVSPTPIYALIRDGIIKFEIIAEKKLINWAEYGELEFNGPAVIVERKVARKGDAADKAILKEVLELREDVKRLSEKLG